MKKHFLKRALSMLLCLVMVLGMMPVLDVHQHSHAAEVTDHAHEEAHLHDHSHEEATETQSTADSQSEASTEWTEEMLAVQEQMNDVVDYYLVYYGFVMPEGEPTEEDYALIEDIVLNKMDDGERENALVSVKEVEYAIEEYGLTEEQAETVCAANPVFVEFADLVYIYSTTPRVLGTGSGDATSTVGVTGLTVTWEFSWNDTTWGTDGTASCTPGTGSISASGSASKNLLGGYTASTATIVLTNTGYDEALLTFTYTDANSKGTITTTGTATGSGSAQSFVLTKNQTVTVKLNTGTSDTTKYTLSLANIRLAEVKRSNVTFTAPVNGSYTVDGTSITSDTVLTNENTKQYSLVATTGSGATFLGWTDGDGNILSTDATVTMTFGEDTTVKAVFAKNGGKAVFMVGNAVDKSSQPGGLVIVSSDKYYYKEVSTAAYLFDDLTAACNAAANSDSKYVVLMNNGTLTGEHTIPSGVTLLIPFDTANTLYTTSPQSNEGGATSNPTAFRTLTMESGAKITVNGAMSLSARHIQGQANAASASPYGPVSFVRMAKGSNITVNSGGVLYAWGYITNLSAPSNKDNTGTVTINSGGHVYEYFQVSDYRGGSATTNAVQMTGGTFPLAQYYVQNVEVPMTLHSGAQEHSFVTIVAQNLWKYTSVAFIGSSGSMFNLTDGYVVKYYDGSTDRLMVESYGNLSVSPVELDLGTGDPINSAEFELPINCNITVDVISGTISIDQDISLLPGAKIIVGENATCLLNANAYLYDTDGWADGTHTLYADSSVSPNPDNGGYFTQYNWPIKVVNYAPGRTYTRTVADLVDAEIVVKGTVDSTNGFVYHLC